MDNLQSFRPEWACPPGETIKEFLEERDWSIEYFAHSIRKSVIDTESLIKGSLEINDDLACLLSKTLGAPSKFWISRETQYRLSLKQIKKNEEWLNQLPISDMIKRGWFDRKFSKKEKLTACLNFFDVTSVSDWYDIYINKTNVTAFRQSTAYSINDIATITWLRKGEIDSNSIHCSAWNKKRFKESLPEIKKLSCQKEPSKFIPEMRRICADSGVALVVAREPEGCRASGAVRFISENKALMILSFRGLSDDQFWFSFFHEAGHLVLHERYLKENNSILVDNENQPNANKEIEKEANDFAFDTLIPKEYQAEFSKLNPQSSYRAILSFSKTLGISPGIVVGQMQHSNKCKKSHNNKLKERYSEEHINQLVL
ncbi:ImmA/IrrE family metallo-endopeptidase [Oceanospirillum sediminis]|uniref:ImmA/IrrE family metallo-endopeptidase n=1 Tax=Oceanospirillum sediminis TaxID=2760088 RepID=A0A839IM23_9GAMM|nr:ImmA/IrrE family metallo-endopeptidase [Oceanospirillum sediminis]MBB1485760.1 ImmA/IrrE family metallo-endopeptidase [Oceanospirillum sediminis]